MSYRNSSGCGGSLAVLIFVGLFFALFAGWTQGNMEWLFAKIAGHPVHVPYVLAMLANLFTNVFGFLFNILCELGKLIWP